MRNNDVIIDETNPFANCKLGRQCYAGALTSVVSTYKDGFVLAVNGKWGSGKTTFMRMWEQSLKNVEYKTIYFNAWENDFTSEPVVAIMGEIRNITTNESLAKFESITKKVYKVASTVLPVLAKTVATLSGLGQVADVLEKLSEATIEAFNDEINKYEQKKQSLKELKTELSEFVKSTTNDKPLIFIIDELDRCRPDYAVEVLEKIKHFFSVDGIVFVLSIDKEQLGYAIQGHYGSSEIDSNEYLRRFIDVEYTLPEPKYKDFCKYLYERYGFADFFEQDERQGTSELSFNKSNFFDVTAAYSAKKKLTLRQLEKIFIHTRIVSRTFPVRNYVHPQIVFILVVLKEYNKPLYEYIKNLECNAQDIATELEKEFADFISIKDRRGFHHSFEHIFAQLMRFYNLAVIRSSVEMKLTESDAQGEEKLAFKLERLDPERILELLKYGSQSDVPILYYITKIDLLEPLIS